MNTDARPVLEFSSAKHLTYPSENDFFMEMLEFKRRRSGRDMVTPPVRNHTSVEEGHLEVRFMGLETPAYGGLQQGFTGYAVRYSGSSESGRVGSYAKYATFRNDTEAVTFTSVGSRAYYRSGGDPAAALDEVRSLLDRRLSSRGLDPGARGSRRSTATP